MPDFLLPSFRLRERGPHVAQSLPLGRRGKPLGMDGGEVHRYFREGRIKEIADYCETDIVNTYRVWLRYESFRGRLGLAHYEASNRALADFLKSGRS